MRYNLFYFTHHDDVDEIHQMQVALSAQVFLIHKTVTQELEARTLRCEDANKVIAYDHQVSFLLRRELLRCIDECNVRGVLTNLEFTPVGDAFLVTGEYWPKDFNPQPVKPEFIVRAYGCRHGEGIKELKEIITIDIKE